MQDNDSLEIDPDNPQAALMPTLWLLKMYLHHGSTGLLHKLGDNLAELSTNPLLAEESRSRLRLLHALWQTGVDSAAEEPSDTPRLNGTAASVLAAKPDSSIH